MDAPVKLVNISAPRHLMQTVYILRNDGKQSALFLPLSELHMDNIGLCVRIEHAMAIKI